MAKVLHFTLARMSRSSFQRSLPLDDIKASLERAEQLVRVPPLAKVIPLRRRKKAWEPALISVPVISPPPPRRDEELILQEVNGCKTLLLEVIRRAAYDWVLYRSSRRLLHRTLAEQAFRWLFLEGPGTPDWEERKREGKHITSFVVICESLDLDPSAVRRHIRRLTPKNVTSVGRPAEYRRRDVFPVCTDDEEVYSLPDHFQYDDTEL
jgi:hypothetical protein